MASKVIIKNRILVPKDLLDQDEIEERYSVQIFKEKNCKKCENLEDRLANGGPNDLCYECPSFIANYKLWKETDKYWSLPQGDEIPIRRVMEKRGIPVVDKRPEYPFKHPIKFIAPLFGKNYVDKDGFPRPNQRKLVRQFHEYETGILECRPRSGKTPMSLKIAIDLGLRTVVLAHKKALLRQFYKTLTAKPTKQRPIQFTNIPDLPPQPAKEPIVLWAQTRAQLKRYKTADFLLVNYQKFVRRPEELAEIINGNFSTVIVDECHNSGAEGYLRVLARCNLKHRIALSATPKRKDGRHKLINLNLGPVVAKSKSVSLIPTITFIQSKVIPKTGYKSWPHAVAFIFNSKQRNEEIVNKVISDMKNGHRTVLIPVDHLKHQLALQEMFNARKKDLAVVWNEKADEEKVLKRVEEDRYTVLIAIRSMIREGVDMLRPSCIHVVVPMSAESEDGVGAPMFDQLVNRICTPFADKPEPLVRIWVDNVGMFQGSIKSLFFHEIWPNRYNPDKKLGKYLVKPHLKDVINGLGKIKQTTGRGWV